MSKRDAGPNHGLTAENILTEFPVALQGDPSVAALADLTARLLARRPEEIERLRIYPAIDQLDEKLLDILAYDYKVDWWDADYSLEEKRRILKDSWRIHKMLGTRAAVETALRAIYPNAEVKEWFEYEGGKPYHFRLNIDLSNEQSDATRPWRVLERVNFYKSLRSHLDTIVFTMAAAPVTLHVGGGVGSVSRIGVPEGLDRFDLQTNLSVGGAFGAEQSIGVPEQPDKPDFRTTLPVGGIFGAEPSISVPEKPDAPEFSSTLHTGGVPSSQTSRPIPEDTTPPPSLTILRTGGVCTIISNLSKGD